MVQHHVQIYPASRFISNIYIGAADNNGKFYLPAMLCPGASAIYLGYPLSWGISIIVIAILTMIIIDEVHMALHVPSAWIDKIPGAHSLRYLHLLHHKVGLYLKDK